MAKKKAHSRRVSKKKPAKAFSKRKRVSMTEAGWNACADPRPMLRFLAGKASSRKLRLLTVACCRRVWHLFTDNRSRAAIELIELNDGKINRELLDTTEAEEAFEEANAAILDHPPKRVPPKAAIAKATASAAWWAVHPAYSTHADSASQATALAMKTATGVDTEIEVQAALLRCVFGPLPFRDITLNPAWLTSTVRSLSQSIYEDRAFDRLPILADALEDGGCYQQDILSHLRGGGEHCRGCWALDLVLRKSDVKALRAVFAALKTKDKILIDEGSCGSYSSAVGQAHERLSKNRKLIGFAAYTKQHAEHAFEAGILGLGYGSRNHDNHDECRAIGQKVVDRLRAAGFTVEWDGAADGRIEVRDLAWDEEPDWD
jgi:hypothetical protein